VFVVPSAHGIGPASWWGQVVEPTSHDGGSEPVGHQLRRRRA
jgi:hypothetical protein